MMPSIADIGAFIAANPHLAYIAVFLLALSEAVPVVGALVPGSALIIGISALAPRGLVSIWPLLACATLGAIVGDGISYWLGHRYHGEILRRWPISHYPELVERSEAFFHRHGAKSVFLARFTPGMRAFVPLVAGMLGMPAGRFYAANILSALAWAPAHIVPGALLGASLALAGAAAGRLAVLLIAIVLIIWLVIWAVRLMLQRGAPLLRAAEPRLRDWASSYNSWLAWHLRSLVDPERPEGRALLLWGAVIIASAWIFFGVLEDVVSGDPLVRIDAVIYRALQHLRTPAGDAVMIGITELGDTAVTTSMTIVIVLWLAWQRAWRTAAYWLAAVGFAAVLNTTIKFAIHRARPSDLAYTGTSEFSFPSGHATVNAVMYGFLAFVIARQLRNVWRFPAFAAVASFAALVAFSRLYLGAHWFSDVAGSLALATAWLAALGMAYVHHRPPSINVKALAVVGLAGLALVGGFNIFRRHAADTERYAVRYEVPSIGATEWWRTGWQQLPAYRIDLTGEIEEPLTLQWAGSLLELENALVQNGWRRPESWTLANALAWLATSDPLKLSVIPSLEAGQMPGLTLIKEDNTNATLRFVLRAWPANIELRNGSTQPLWVGSIVEERILRPLSFITFVRTEPNITRTRALLAEALKGAQLVKREIPQANRDWDGFVLLAHEQSLIIPPSPQSAGGK